MAPSTDIKKKRGRPPKPGGATPGVFVRLPPDVLAAVDVEAEGRGATRSDVIREAVYYGVRHVLKAKAKTQAKRSIGR